MSTCMRLIHTSAHSNRAGVDDLVVSIIETSEEAAKDWNKPISFLWIDGDHSYSAAKLDFDLFSKWVVDGGVIAFHDSTQGEVPKVVFEVFQRKGLTKIGRVVSIT